MKLKVYLDSQLVPESDVSNLDDATFTLARSDNRTGATSKSFSGNLTFYNATGQYIRDILVNSPTARQNRIQVEIRQDPECCDFVLFKGIIKAEQIEWCDIVAGSAVCNTVSCQVVEETPYTCLESTLIDINSNGFQTARHPFVPHCIELRPNFLAFLVYYFAVILFLNFTFLIPIIAVFSTMISIFNVVLVLLGFNKIDFSDDPGTQSLLDVWIELRNSLLNAMVGCGNGQFAPYVRDYLQNLCKTCNLQLDSTIFSPGSPYYDTMYYTGAVSKIEKYDVNNQQDREAKQAQWFADNSPNETGVEFLNNLILAYNAGWEVRQGRLVFERKDKFFSNPITIDPANITNICFKYKSKGEPQFAQFAFSPDGIETCGNEVLRRNYYRIQDYDPTNIQPNLAGRRKYVLPFAGSRFRNDGVDTDVLSFFVALDITGFFFPDDYENALIKPDNVNFLPKLLIHKTDSGLDNAQVKWVSNGSNFDYNRDYWFSPQYNYNDGIKNEYYDRFWQIDEPLVTGRLGRTFEMTIEYTCEFLKNFSIYNTLNIDTGQGIKIGQINQVEISETSLILRGEI
jgi:hypothetical protein